MASVYFYVNGSDFIMNINNQMNSIAVILWD